MIVAASVTLLAESRAGRQGGALPWALLAAGSVAVVRYYCLMGAADPSGARRIESSGGLLPPPPPPMAGAAVRPDLRQRRAGQQRLWRQAAAPPGRRADEAPAAGRKLAYRSSGYHRETALYHGCHSPR